MKAESGTPEHPFPRLLGSYGGEAPGPLVIGIGGMLLYTGRDISGLVTLVTALVSLVSVFVYGRRKEAEERQRKRNDFGR